MQRAMSVTLRVLTNEPVAMVVHDLSRVDSTILVVFLVVNDRFWANVPDRHRSAGPKKHFRSAGIWRT